MLIVALAQELAPFTEKPRLRDQADADLERREDSEMRVMALAGVVVAASSVNAHANWQYTRWAMTPMQTIEASAGQLKDCYGQEICGRQSTKSEIARLIGAYQWGDLKFTAYMRFESGTNALSSVLLSLDDPKDADSLIALMRVTYGAPLLEKQYGFNISTDGLARPR